jgi:hypothetical protein
MLFMFCADAFLVIRRLLGYPLVGKGRELRSLTVYACCTVQSALLGQYRRVLMHPSCAQLVLCCARQLPKGRKVTAAIILLRLPA